MPVHSLCRPTRATARSWVIILSLLFSTSVLRSQDISSPPSNLPASYKSLSSDTARMRFLVKAINDSLDEDQLNNIYGWSVAGLKMAEQNNVDTMKGIFNFFIAKAFGYKYQKLDSAIKYYKKVLPYFPDRSRKYNVFSIREIMESYSETGNKDSCFVYLDTLKAFIDTMPDDSPKKVSLSQNIATVYQWFGMSRTAVHYYEIAIKGQRKNNNIPGLGIALANLGEFYDETENDIKAVEASREALGYLKNINMPFEKTASNLAGYFSNLGRYDSALYYLKISKDIADNIDDIEQKNYINIVLADIYMGLKKYDSAGILMNKNKDLLIKRGETSNLAKTYLSLAALDTVNQNYTSAKSNLLLALKIAKQNKQQVLIIIALQNLARVEAKLKNYKDAYQYVHQFMVEKDSMTSEKTKANLADLEVSYQTNQKEEKIKLLQQANNIKDLQLAGHRRTSILFLLIFVSAASIAGVIIFQRNLRSKLEAKKLKAELETKVLRLQMNPHFIFNCLNSIENFIMSNEKRLASDYLNKFARLIRIILDSSRTEVVPVPRDMEALRLYIDLEQLRFNNKFSYDTYIDPVLLGGDFRAPSLLIQPYVENAIIHGLANSEEDGLMLTISAILENDKIKYTVQDNGIGRKKSEEYNRMNKPYHQSIGMQITEQRIHLFNNYADGAVKITDLYNADKMADGTKVEITINAG